MQLLDQIPSYDTHKIAVLYVGEGQVRPWGQHRTIGSHQWVWVFDTLKYWELVES